MPYRSGWYIPNKILFTQVWGVHTEAEVYETQQILARYLDEGEKPIYMVSHNQHITKLAAGLSANIRALKMLRHPDLKVVFQVGVTNPFVKTSAAIIANVMQVKTVNVTTTQEALDWLSKYDATIKWSLANEAMVEDYNRIPENEALIPS